MMPDFGFKALFEGQTGLIVAATLGAFLRGVIGPGPWRWGEFMRALLVGVVFVLWVGPGITEWLELGERAAVSVGVLLGMVALPLTRGLIALARAFRDNPERVLGGSRRGDDDRR